MTLVKSIGSSEPIVSVIVPAYNARTTIERAVRSVVAQAGCALEIIVIDDCSADGTADFVESLAVRSLRVIRLQSNHGASWARNEGIRAARGEFISFLDADDEWLPGKLSRQLSAFGHDLNVTLVSCDSVIQSLDGRKTRHHDGIVRIAEGREAWKTLLASNFIPTPTVVCRRADVLAVGGFRSDLHFGEDLDLWIRLALRGSVVVLRDIFVNIYNQPYGLSRTTPKAELRFVLPMIRAHVEAEAKSLSRSERRYILGNRLFDIGYRTYWNGHTADARPLFLQAALTGTRVAKSMYYFIDCVLDAPLRRWRTR